MKRIFLILLAVVLLVVVPLVWACSWMQAVANTLATGWALKKADTGELIIRITASGSVEPLASVQVGSQASGKVKQVCVEPDETVHKGQVLAVLDTELAEAERKDRVIQLEHARTSLDMLAVERESLDLREARLKLNQARGRIALERTRATLELASKNLQRYRDLFKADAVSQTELDIRGLERDNAERDLRLQENELEQQGVELRQVAADRKGVAARERQAEGAVGQAKQELGKAETNLTYATITAPCDGVVLERLVEPGQTIAAQFQTPILFKLVADLKTVRIQALIDEADVGKIRAGQRVSFEVDAQRGEKFGGTVRAVRLKNENRQNLVTYPVLIEAENPASAEYPHGKLLPGMTAFLTFEVEKRPGVTRLPASALRFVPPEGTAVDRVPDVPEAARKPADAEKPKEKPRGLLATVYQAAEGGRLKALNVRVGDNDGEFYELLSGGVKAGDEFVVGKVGAAGGENGAASVEVEAAGK